MFIIAGLCGSAAAAVVTTGTFTASASEGSTSDLFQNATVTDGTSTNTQFDLFHIGDLFTQGTPIRQNDVVFADTNGTTSFVEFNIPAATALESIDVVLQSDGLAGPTAFERALDQVRIYASTSSGTVLANLVADIAVDPDYDTAYGGTRVTLTIDFPVAVTAQYFRAEFDQPAFMAPRVYEIDGFAPPFVFTGSTTILPEPWIGDATDDFQNAMVTAHADLHPETGDVIEDLFNAESAIVTEASLVFKDEPATAFVDFNLSSQIGLTNMVFTIENEDPARALDEIKIYAGTSPEVVPYNQVAGFAVDPDYLTAYGSTRISVSVDFAAAVTAQYFRVEFGRVDGVTSPRIMEIDGYGTLIFDNTSSTTIMPELNIGDPSDDFQNAIVTAHADLYPGLGDVIEDLFSAWSAIVHDGSLIFADEPTTAFVDFNLPTQIGLTNMVFTIENEDPGRALNEIKVYAGDSPEVVPYRQVAGFAVDPDYLTAYGSTRISVSVDFAAAVTAQYFRVEFGRVDGVTSPRVMEIDGYGTLVFNNTGTGEATAGTGSPWDDFQFATVTASTPLHVANDTLTVSDLFTMGSPVVSDDQMFFEDGATSFVDFNLSGGISLTNLVVTLQNEGSPAFGRSVKQITVYASTLPGDVLSKPVASVAVNPDYESYPGGSTRIALSIDFPTAVNAQYFRVELKNNTLAGCRIWEIDGWGAPYVIAGVPATIISLEPVSSTVLKMVIDAPSAAEHYFPQASTDLISVSPAVVAHSDTPSGPFSITNLSHSASEGDNKVIYVESDSVSKFYTVEYSN